MSKLILVGVPIGNLADISVRSIKSIFESTVIACEDTRSFTKLKGLLKLKYALTFNALGVTPIEKGVQKIISYRDQNHIRVVDSLINYLKSGVEVTLVSDAGMPAISDPGWKLINAVITNGFEIDVFPGPTAVTSSLVLSGLPTDRYTFLGFLPRNENKVRKLVSKFWDISTVIVFESPYRVRKTIDYILGEAKEKQQEVSIALCCDITKAGQKIYRGTSNNIVNIIKNIPLKGEWVICIRAVK